MKLRPALHLFFCSFTSATNLIPRPNGPYGTSVKTLGMIDSSRLDPFAPNLENRSIVISAFYPIYESAECQWTLVPVYPARTAALFDAEVAFAGVPNGTLETVRMEICLSQNLSVQEIRGSDCSEAPIILFSGGLGLSRLWYSALAQSVASYGFTVVTIDHPYDADVVEFPDGHLVFAINSTWDDKQSEEDVNVRADDASFVLDELSKPEVVEELFHGKKSLATDRVGIFGHSLGGAAAAMAMFQDHRIVGGVNLDGGLYGPVINQGLKDPFMLFAHKSNSTTPTWPAIWPHLDWKLDINLLNSTHTSFTDIPLLAELIFGTPLPQPVQEIVGELPGTRARDVVTAYVVSFMKMILECQPQSLLQRSNANFPEIEFVESPRVN